MSLPSLTSQRTAARPEFRKLYGKIENTDLEVGTYTVTVSNGVRLPGYDGLYNPARSAAYYADPLNAPVAQTFLWPAHTFGTKVRAVTARNGM